MSKFAYRHRGVAGLAAVALIAVGCSGGNSVDTSASPQTTASAPSSIPAPPAEVKLVGVDNVEVVLTGPIAAKYSSATEDQRKALGIALTGDRNAGTRDNGVVFQQFQGGVITAKDGQIGTPAYITTGKIREAWNVQRGPDGAPSVTGTNGSAGPLGFPISDVKAVGDLQISNFENGKIEFSPKTGQVEVTVNGKVVPSGL